MKRTLLALALSLIPPVARSAPTDGEVEAQNRALQLASAFANDGFKTRDGHWAGPIKSGEGKLIQVNLYAGNQYWFCVAATDTAKKMQVTIFDENGKPIVSEPYQESATAAAGYSPTASGAYFIKVEQVEGEPASYCLLYAYK